MAYYDSNQSDPGASSCDSDPNFAVVCSFLEMFGKVRGLNVDFLDLQEMLENTEEVPTRLMNLHITLMRAKRANKILPEQWEKVLTRLCIRLFDSEDARQLEQLGYKNMKLSTKLRILKNLVEFQFDNHKFRKKIQEMYGSSYKMRSKPLGMDNLGNTYWFQSDHNYQIRVYKEDSRCETWTLVASDKESLFALIPKLKEELKFSSNSAVNDDSSSLMEEPIMDTGPNDTSSSDLKKASEKSENTSDSKMDETKQEITDGTDETSSEKTEDLSLVENFSSKSLEVNLQRSIVKPNSENYDKDKHLAKRTNVGKKKRSESKLSSDSAANDDSSSLTEKLIMDTGHNDTSSSDLKKTSEENENMSRSKMDEVKQETDGTETSEKTEDLSLVKNFSTKSLVVRLQRLIVKSIKPNCKNFNNNGHLAKRTMVGKRKRTESKLSFDSAFNDDSSSSMEERVMDTSQSDKSSSDFEKASEESENPSDSKRVEAKHGTDGTEKEDLSSVKDFISKRLEVRLLRLKINPMNNLENFNEGGHLAKRAKVEKSRINTRTCTREMKENRSDSLNLL